MSFFSSVSIKIRTAISKISSVFKEENKEESEEVTGEVFVTSRCKLSCLTARLPSRTGKSSGLGITDEKFSYCL